MLTNEQKKYRDSANRARRELFKEQEKCGFISDGSGKRYRACVYYVLSGAPEKAADFMDWFEQEFTDDAGEPAFLLFAALAYHRIGNLNKASAYLLDAMLSNVYMLPGLFGSLLPKQDMWHPSNREMPDYIEQIADFLDEPTNEERDWIKHQFEGNIFTDARHEYIETFRALQHADDYGIRKKLLDDWREYEINLRTKLGIESDTAWDEGKLG